MSGELAIRTETSTLRLSGSDVLDAFLSGRNANTLEAYEFDLSDFARFVGARLRPPPSTGCSRWATGEPTGSFWRTGPT